jgi:hypothetical protein
MPTRRLLINRLIAPLLASARAMQEGFVFVGSAEQLRLHEESLVHRLPQDWTGLRNIGVSEMLWFNWEWNDEWCDGPAMLLYSA